MGTKRERNEKVLVGTAPPKVTVFEDLDHKLELRIHIVGSS